MVLFTQNILSHVCIKILRSKIINSKVTSLSMCVFSCYHRIFIKNGLKTNISTSIFDSRYCWVHWKNSTTLLTLKIHDFKLQIDHNKVWNINILVKESDIQRVICSYDVLLECFIHYPQGTKDIRSFPSFLMKMLNIKSKLSTYTSCIFASLQHSTTFM